MDGWQVISADHARIPAAIALQLCAESPEALAVLCRVLWFARGSGECFASCATMRTAGAAMALPVLRRGLVALQDRGLLLAIANPERSCVTYRPTPALAKSPRSVFIPPEVWRGCKPSALAAWVVWRLLGCDAGELGAHVGGRASKALSRSQGYAIFRTLKAAGLCPDLVRKTTPTQSGKCTTNTDLSKTYEIKNIYNMDLSNAEDMPPDLTGLQPLELLPPCEPEKQLALPIRAPLRVVRPEMTDPLAVGWIDWIEVSEHNPGASAAIPAAKVPTLSASMPFEGLAKAWRELVAACPVLAPAKVLLTPTGLPESEQRALASQWQDCAPNYELCAIAQLADYINAGGLAWCKRGVAKYVATKLDSVLASADKWRADGCPALTRVSLQPSVQEGDILSRLTKLQSRTG